MVQLSVYYSAYKLSLKEMLQRLKMKIFSAEEKLFISRMIEDRKIKIATDFDSSHLDLRCFSRKKGYQLFGLSISYPS